MAVGNRCADHVTPLYPQKLALTSSTGGGRSVGIVRSRTKATEFFYNGGDLCIIMHSFKDNANTKWHTLTLLFCLRPSLVLEVDVALHSSTWVVFV